MQAEQVSILYESGTWTKSWKEESPNFGEMDSIVTKIESLVGDEKIQGQEVFMFTDNSTFESTYYQG